MAGTLDTKTIDGQSRIELDELISYLRFYGVKSILEIGSRYGHVIRKMAEDLKVDKAVAVDLPFGPWGRQNSDQELRKNIKALREQGIKAEMILGDSHDEQTISKARSLGPYDFVFIDADHRYEGVKADWENYGPMGTFVGFHDVAGDGKIAGKTGYMVEVGKLWRQIRGDEYVEFVESGRRLGIGVIKREI